MGLMGTLAKVAIGYAAARGVDRMSKGQGIGGLLGGGAQRPASDPNARAQAQIGEAMTPGGAPGTTGNPMQDMMAQIQKGGFGGLMAEGSPLANMMKTMQSGSGGFDLQKMMGSTPGQGGDGKSGLLSQLGAGGTGLAGLLAAMSGAAAQAQGRGAEAMIDAFDTEATAPEAEKAASLMLRAMIQAAKADGGIDASERAKIVETLGPNPEAGDLAFIEEQMKAPVDAKALAADTPAAQRMQVYSASLMTIRVDTEAEALYLDELAKAMELEETTVNALHMQMGLQPLYA